MGYYTERMIDEYDYEVEQDSEPINIPCVYRGEEKLAVEIHWRNGEHHFTFEDGSKAPIVHCEFDIYLLPE
jgi:hypothetical protein